jgi:hypothetical protein
LRQGGLVHHAAVHVPFDDRYVALCAVQAAVVLLPRPSPVLLRSRWLGLIPLLAIGGVVLVMGSDPSLAQDATDLAAIATPILACAGIVAFRVRWLAVAAPVAYVVAWRSTGRPADVATDLLIAGACATLAWLTGMVAPRGALSVGIVVAAVVDCYQVLVTKQVQPVAQALGRAVPVHHLPRLQEAVFGGATMGWGDVYLAALLGVVLALSTRRIRLEAAAVVFVAGVLMGFAFDVLDTLPATVPVATALGWALAREARRRTTEETDHGNHRFP